MKNSRKIWCVILIIAFCLPLSGCGYRELYERLLIHGVGVDMTEGGFTVTVRSSISTEDEGEEYFKTEGKSVLEALNNLSLRTGRQPFYAHNYLVVFGKSCAEQGLDECLDFFVRYYNTRPGVQLFLAENTAEEVMAAESDGKLMKMSELQQLATAGKINGKTVGVDLLDFVNGVKRQGSAAIMPVVKATDEGVEMASTAYFKGYRQKGTLTTEQVRGYLAAKGEIEKGELVISGTTLTLSKGEGKITAKIEEDKANFLIKAEISADISDVRGQLGPVSLGTYKNLEEEAGAVIRKEVESAIEQAVKEDGCDIFGFGNLLYREFPEFWRENGEKWPQLMKESAYTVEVSVTVAKME